MNLPLLIFFFFFFNDTATPEIYPLSLPDPLPISWLAASSLEIPDLESRPRARSSVGERSLHTREVAGSKPAAPIVDHGASESVISSPSSPCFRLDRKSTRLNSSHSQIPYAVFGLKEKIREPRRARPHAVAKASRQQSASHAARARGQPKQQGATNPGDDEPSAEACPPQCPPVRDT